MIVTVKKLTEQQKLAIVTIYRAKTRTIKEIAFFLGVSARTVSRVLEEKNEPLPMAVRSAEASHVMQLLYKHKMTVDQLEQLLNNPTARNPSLWKVEGQPIHKSAQLNLIN